MAAMYSVLALAVVVTAVTDQSLLHRVKRQCPCAELIVNPCVCQVGLPRCTCLNVIPQSSCGCNAQAQNLVCLSSCENNCARTCARGSNYVGCPSSCRYACSQSCAIQQPVRAPVLVPINLSCPNLCQQTCGQICGESSFPFICIPLCRYECKQKCSSIEQQAGNQTEEATVSAANAEQQSLQNSEQDEGNTHNPGQQEQPIMQGHGQELLLSGSPGPVTALSLSCPSACEPLCEPKCIFEHQQELSRNLSVLPDSAPHKVCSPVCMPSCAPDCIEEQERISSENALPIYLQPGNAPECIAPCKPACTPQCVGSHQPSSAGQPKWTTTSSTTEVEHIAYDTPAVDTTTQGYPEEIAISTASPSFEIDQQQQILASQTPPVYLQPATPPTCIAPCMPGCTPQCINEHLEFVREQSSELSTIAAAPDSTTLQNPITLPTPPLSENATLLNSNSSYPCIESCMPACDPQCIQAQQNFSRSLTSDEQMSTVPTIASSTSPQCESACMPTCDPQCILEREQLIASTLAASSVPPTDPLFQQESHLLPMNSERSQLPGQPCMDESTSANCSECVGKQVRTEEKEQTTLLPNSHLQDLQGKSSLESSWNAPRNCSGQEILAYPTIRIKILLEEELLEKAAKCGCTEQCARQCRSRQNQEQCEKACQIACAQECSERLQ